MQDNSQVIELGIVGALFVYKEDLAEKLNFISADDFESRECQEIINTIKLNPEDDTVIILSKLSSNAQAVVNMAIDNFRATKENFDSYVNKLKEYAISRNIKNQIMPYLMDNNDGILDAQILIDIANNNQKSEFSSYEQEGKKGLDIFIENATKKTETIKSGFSGFDNLTGGFLTSAISIIGALPSTGKTALALNFVITQMLANVKTVVFSLEMSNQMIYERLATTFNDMDYSKFTTKNYSNNDLKNLNSFKNALACLDLYVFDNKYNIKEQEEICMSIKPKFIVVDYVQLVKTDKKTKDAKEIVDDVITRYKQLAKSINAHILILSQLKRGNEKQPTMRDLKESGALEATGDYIMLLSRPYVYDKENYQPNETRLLLDKNKFGKTGILNLSFVGESQKFYEIDNRYEE